MSDALLVIDVQSQLTGELRAERRREFLQTLATLLSRARERGVPVVYIQHHDDELVKGTPAWEIDAGIAPLSGEPVVEKTFRDSFRETDLERVLETIGAKRLVVCGMQTEYCVDATIREAERRGYDVTLVADGTATFPAGGASEAQIRDQVYRVAWDTVARIVPSAELFS